jgi:hypothetical protein
MSVCARKNTFTGRVLPIHVQTTFLIEALTGS